MSVNLTIQLPFRTVRTIQEAGSNNTEVARNLKVDEAGINAIALLDVTPVSEGVKKLDDTAVPDAAPVSDGGRFINITIRDDRGFRKKEHDVRMHNSWSVSQLKQWIRTAGVAWHSDIVLRFGGRPLGSSKGDEWWKDQQPLSAVSALSDETFGRKAVPLRLLYSTIWATDRRSCCFASRSLQTRKTHTTRIKRGQRIRCMHVICVRSFNKESEFAGKRLHVKGA